MDDIKRYLLELPPDVHTELKIKAAKEKKRIGIVILNLIRNGLKEDLNSNRR